MLYQSIYIRLRDAENLNEWIERSALFEQGSDQNDEEYLEGNFKGKALQSFVGFQFMNEGCIRKNFHLHD